MNNMKAWIGIVVIALLAGEANAALFCAGNSVELQNHLDTAEANGEDDTIRLRAGTYVGNFRYNPTGSEPFALSLQGDYTTFLSNPCGRRLKPAPGVTVLDGNMSGRPLQIVDAGGAVITINRIGFTNGLAPSGQAGGGGLEIFALPSDPIAEVNIEDALFAGNMADSSSALKISQTDTVRIRNSIFETNHAVVFAGVAAFDVRSEGLQFINNTVINNTATGSFNAGVYVLTADTGQAVLVNNIIWGNDGADFYFAGGNSIYLYNNNIEDLSGQVAENVDGVSIAPEFLTGPFNYELVTSSPLVDAGRLAPTSLPANPPFKDTWTLPARDIRNADRVRGNGVDLGAFESLPDLIFQDSFE